MSVTVTDLLDIIFRSRRQELAVNWAQLTRHLLENGDSSQAPKRYFYIKDRTVDNAQKVNNYTDKY